MDVVVITGASSGIGRETANLYASKGYKVYNLDLRDSNFEGVEFIKCDIRVEEEIKNAIDRISKIDVLVNCAGIFGCYYVEDTPTSYLDNIVDVNLKGHFLVTKLCLPKLRKSKGNIVFVSSGLGINTDPTCPAYCMTKAGINMFVKCLALTEAKCGVRVNAVLPGPIYTPLLLEWFENEQQLDKYASLNPQNMIGTVEYVANAIYFLSDKNNKYINGALLAVDGGESISSILPTKVRRKKYDNIQN